jgi:hypothetical protein
MVSYKQSRINELQEYLTLIELARKRRQSRFRRALSYLQEKGQGAILCPSSIEGDHYESQWFLVDKKTWKQTEWFERWKANTRVAFEDIEYIYIKLNESYTGAYHLPNFQINKPSTHIYGLWYLTPTELLSLSTLIFYPTYNWISLQVPIDVSGLPHGELVQNDIYRRDKADGGEVIIRFDHGRILWSKSTIIDAYFHNLMFFNEKMRTQYLSYHKATYGNEPKLEYRFDKDGIPGPIYFSGLFTTDIPRYTKYLALTGLSKHSITNRCILLDMRYSR